MSNADDDLDLEGAFRAVKDTYDGTSPDADLTLQRALFASRAQTRRRKVVRWTLIPIAAALFASTAWAGATGRLAPVVESVREALHAETSAPAESKPPAPRAATAPPANGHDTDDGTRTGTDERNAQAETANEEASATDADANAATAEKSTANDGSPSGTSVPTGSATSTSVPGRSAYGANANGTTAYGANVNGANANGTTANRANANRANANGTTTNGASANGTTANGANANGTTAKGATMNGANANRANANPANATGTGGATSGAPATTPSSAAADPNAQLFADAHRIHFLERDPARALVAWDRYLAAAPNGSLAPEARYNRALALIRLQRNAEARAELEKFAEGTYRRAEARALLDALPR